MEFISHWIVSYGYFGIYTLLMLGIVGIPVPDETLLAFAGYLVYTGKLSLLPTMISAFLGSITGITLSFIIGKSFGLYLLRKYGKYIHITEERIEKAHQWFEKIGRWSLVLGYFIPGVRHLTALIAGSAKLETYEFVIFAYSGALVWSSLFILLGYFIGEQWSTEIEKIQHHLMLASIIVTAFVILAFVVHRVYINKKKKKLSKEDSSTKL